MESTAWRSKSRWKRVSPGTTTTSWSPFSPCLRVQGVRGLGLAKLAKFGQILQNFANFWRARSRLYQNEILQENMRLTAFFKLYKICILLHRCNLKIFAKIGLKNQQFLWKFSKIFANVAKFAKISEILQIFGWFFLLNFHKNCWFFRPIFCENFQIAAVQKDANLVELEKCCQTHIFLQNFVLIQPRTSPPKICKILSKCCQFCWP